MVKYMYKVTILSTGEIVMFEEKGTAQDYVAWVTDKGEMAVVNKWTWRTEIED